MLITGLLHIAIIYAFMQRQHAADIPRAPREAMQWLLPMARPAAKSPPKPQVKSEPQAKVAPTPKAITLPAVDVSPSPPAIAPTPASIPDDPFAQAPVAQRPPSASDILNQARLDVRKIDKELRAAYPERAPVPPPDSKQARLERGIDAAHEAVPPKWYQAAKIIELSTPDGENKTRTYKIVTAIVTYCINIHPDGRRSYANCPR
ncbi:hypothetical protein [Duganella violaceipulchra]|uniref:Uncharacterized protein n=1 Tax=Duganella violaceipulchra TaxID=2849652 RepID=A0AA41H3G2_9BURK|nr:hypothetical protein [Duganella violaceicalia]MBV6320148.1 hypothetical protein [Duganella violaceicalia]MCP2010515.1 hypothetical protein [Duganella violaceicalia]